MGDSCAQGGKPGIKETGTPEDVPRTAAITHAAGIKKAPADVMGALMHLELHGFPHPAAELAATCEAYRADPHRAIFQWLLTNAFAGTQPEEWEYSFSPPLNQTATP